MAVQHTFAPNTIIKSALVNANNTGITDGSAMNDVANNIVFQNAHGISVKDSGGIERKVLQLEASDNVTLWTNVDGRVVVIDRMPRRNHNANTYVDSHIQRGWGYIQGDGNNFLTTTVTLPKAYSVITFAVVCGNLGSNNVAPTNEADFDGWHPFAISAFPKTTGTFEITLMSLDVGDIIDNDYYGYCWIAIGVV